MYNTIRTRPYFIFQAIIVLSEEPGDGPDFKASLKLKLEKSTFATDSLRYLNLIYVKGFKVINLNNFKRSSHYIDTLPVYGDELRSALGFFNFLLSFCKALRYHMKQLESFATKHPAKKLISWDQHPEIKEKYYALCKVVKASNSLHTLPSDLNQVGKIIFNSDACKSCLAPGLLRLAKNTPNLRHSVYFAYGSWNNIKSVLEHMKV